MPTNKKSTSKKDLVKLVLAALRGKQVHVIISSPKIFLERRIRDLLEFYLAWAAKRNSVERKKNRKNKNGINLRSPTESDGP